MNNTVNLNLEAIEDQLSDIQTALAALTESSAFNSEDYWRRQEVELTKLYLKDMIAQRHRDKVKLTEADVVKLVSVANNVAQKSIEALKKVYNKPASTPVRYGRASHVTFC